jgi:hypothetical protein
MNDCHTLAVLESAIPNATRNSIALEVGLARRKCSCLSYQTWSRHQCHVYFDLLTKIASWHRCDELSIKRCTIIMNSRVRPTRPNQSLGLLAMETFVTAAVEEEKIEWRGRGRWEGESACRHFLISNYPLRSLSFWARVRISLSLLHLTSFFTLHVNCAFIFVVSILLISSSRALLSNNSESCGEWTDIRWSNIVDQRAFYVRSDVSNWLFISSTSDRW